MTVECVNCGDGPELWIALGSMLLAAGSLVVAVVAVVFAKRAADAADESLKLTREGANMARHEHDVFLRQLQARADLRLTLRTINADDDGVLRTTGSSVSVRVEVGVSNEGDEAAGQTTVNVLAPRRTEGFRWTGPRGEDTEFTRLRPAETDEKLRRADGDEVEAEYLNRMLDQVRLRAPIVLYVRFMLNVPDQGERVVPLRAKVGADELPEGVDEVVTEHLVRVERVRA